MIGPFPSRDDVLRDLDKTIKEKPHLSDWTDEEKRMLSYVSFCDNVVPAGFCNFLFWVLIICILLAIIGAF